MLEQSFWEEGRLPVTLTKVQIEQSPDGWKQVKVTARAPENRAVTGALWARTYDVNPLNSR